MPVTKQPASTNSQALSDLELEVVSSGKTVLGNLLLGGPLRALGNRLGADAGASIGQQIGGSLGS